MKVPFGDVFVLLLYLLPGFLAIQIYRKKHPAKQASQFEVVVWSVLHSFIVLLLLAGASYTFGLSSLNLLEQSGSSKIGATSIMVLLAGGSLWGFVLIGSHWCRTKLPFLRSPDPLAIWPVAAARVARNQLWALVRTKEGRLYLGWIEKYSFDPSMEDHDFLLRPAYLVNEDLEVERDLERGGVYLNTRDMESLEMIPGQ